MTKVALYIPKDRLIQADSLEKAVKLTPRAVVAPKETPAKMKEQSPWKAHREFEKQVTDNVSDRLLELFLTIRRQWLHQKGEFHKAQGDRAFKINGRIFINPKTGKPLTQKQWAEVVKTLDQAMVRLFADQPEILVRRAMLLGKILQGMDYEARKNTQLTEMPTALQMPKVDSWQNAYTFGKSVSKEIGKLSRCA